MAEKSTVSMRPRYYECDPLNQLHVANYVRYMLQAAIEAGAANDHGAPALTVAEWLNRVGDIGLQIVEPARFGDALEMQTWLGRCGAHVWRREFTLRKAASGGVAANGFVDTFDESDEPEPDAEAPVAESDTKPAWDGPVPEPPEPPGRPFRVVWRVAWPQADISGNIDPAWLTHLVGDVENRAAEAAGWTDERDEEHGIAWQVVEHRLEMFEAIQPGDKLEVTSYIGDVGDEDMVRHTLMERKANGMVDLVARARTRRACLNAETGQRTAIPDDWLLDLEGEMSKEAE